MKQLITLLVILLLSGCSSDKSTALQQVKDSGKLTVLTRNGPTTYYQGPHGPAGLEYELLHRFSEFLGVKLEIIARQSLQEILPALTDGSADMVAAGITVTAERQKQYKFSIPYQSIFSQVVYLSGKHRPRSVDDLPGKVISVVSHSSHEELMKNLQQEYKDLSWQAVDNISVEQQFKRILSGEIDYTVADSNDIAINRRYYPKIRIGFNISEAEQLAWVFPIDQDDSLKQQADKFIKKLQDNKELEYLIERYYGFVNRLNFVDKRTFFQHMESRLVKYRDDFKKAAKETGYDWKLLAAIAYQESHWNPRAKSPTGVRGMMMLTQATARQMKIKDRTSAAESIIGGARYLKKLEKKIPKRIGSPDRLWLALASYNIGYGHLEDARILTQRNGGDPDKWLDIKKNLPKLSDPEVYKTLKYGYARGQEPANYVDNIRNFYDLILWKEQNSKASETKQNAGILDWLFNLFN